MGLTANISPAPDRDDNRRNPDEFDHPFIPAEKSGFWRVFYLFGEKGVRLHLCFDVVEERQLGKKNLALAALGFVLEVSELVGTALIHLVFALDQCL